ncbi:hypothetical protein [Vitreimonas sp.]|jgi:hypothetical protein|uniref:hypothetical protein n=1 Tax=Vitreimonas sp. TaxID=3069702 RepID=UPI002EDA442B
MRSWLFHPLLFYPFVLIVAALVIAVSLKPQSWPREPAPVVAQLTDGTLVFQGEAFNSPSAGPEQDMTVVRDFWGQAQTLRIAQLAGQPAPTPAEQGVRLLLTPEQAALLEDKSATIEISYRPLPINMASALAVSIQGIGPATWVTQPLAPETGTVRFEAPAQFAVNGIGLRAVSSADDQAYGVEITRVRVTPHSS